MVRPGPRPEPVRGRSQASRLAVAAIVAHRRTDRVTIDDHTHLGERMLSLTDNAKAAITGITAQSGLPDSGGVRLSLAPAADQVEMALVPEPQAQDAVIDEDGARVFVDRERSEEHTSELQSRGHLVC